MEKNKESPSPEALFMEPKYLFADEPTGSLNTVNGEGVMNMLKEAHQDKGTMVVLVTHDPDYANRAERQINIADVKVISDPKKTNMESL